MNRSIFYLLVGAFLMISCGESGPATEEKESLKPVKFGEVKMSNGALNRTFNGTCQSGSEINLSFRANGLITQLNVKVGDVVKKGQLIAQLDQRDASLAYEQARSALQSAKIQLQTSESNLARIKELYQANNISLNDYEQAKNNFAGAKSAHESAQKSLDLQASQLSYTRITSPASGVVSAVNAEVNEFAQAGATIIVINSQEDDIEINIGIPEVYITRIKKGDAVGIEFSSIKGKRFEGKVTEVGFSISGVATYPVIVKIINPSSEIRPGMPSNVTFQLGEGKGNGKAFLVVPIKAVSEDPGGKFVFSLSEESGEFIARKQKVEIGDLVEEGFEVTAGLEEGDLVATAGIRSLYDGRKVKLLED